MNQRGFGLTGILVIIIIILAAGTGGVYVVKNTNLNNQEVDSNTITILTDNFTKEDSVPDVNNTISLEKNDYNAYTEEFTRITDWLAPTDSFIDNNMLLQDYSIKYIRTTDRIPNTIRIQFYGPKVLQGYNNQNELVTSKTIFPPCKGFGCNNTNRELRMDFADQGGNQYSIPIVSVSVNKVLEEYQDYLKNNDGKVFKSSILTISLPTSPLHTEFSKATGYNSWFGVVYYDNNGNKQYDLTGDDWSIASTDEIEYIWDSFSNTQDKFTYGWNFNITTNLELKKRNYELYKNDLESLSWYRKSFEQQITFIPILTPEVFLLSQKIPEKNFISDDIIKRDSKRISDIKDIQIGLELYYDQHNIYPKNLYSLVNEGYINMIPTNPIPGGMDYTYRTVSDDNDYLLEFSLESNYSEPKFKAGKNIVTCCDYPDLEDVIY